MKWFMVLLPFLAPALACLPFVDAAALNRRVLHHQLAQRRAKRLKYEARRKQKYEALRRKLTEHPRLRSVADYARDAQRDRVLLRFRGRNVPGARAAMASRDVLKRRYKRTQEFAGKTDGQWKLFFALSFIVGGAGVALAAYGITGWMDPTGAKGFNKTANAIVAGVAGGGIGPGGIYAIYLRKMWTTSHDLIHIVEHAVKGKPWLLTAIVRVYLPRLGFAAHDFGRVFSGGSRNSGILEGSVVLQLPEGVRAETLKNVRDVYKLPKKEGRYSGTSTRAIDGRVERVVGLSKRRAALKAPEKHAWMDRLGPYVVTAMCVIYLILSNGGG